jgi:hypothetical protein
VAIGQLTFALRVFAAKEVHYLTFRNVEAKAELVVEFHNI